MPSGHSPRLRVAAPVVRESWMAYDNLISKAFAARQTPSGTDTITYTSTPTLRDMDLHPLDEPPRTPKIVSPDERLLEPIWDAVRQLKAKHLAAMPSKVKSLEGVELEPSPPAVPAMKAKTIATTEKPPPVDTKKLKRKSSATFKESSNGRLVTAVFDMTGVDKQDMHVSFRANRIVVTWRRVKMMESKEDGVTVRERKEKQYSQMIPLPEGTSFDEVRAARSGNYLMLTFPNLRCVKVDSVATSSTAWSSGETDFFTCEAGTMLDMEEFLVENRAASQDAASRSKSIRRP